MKADRGSVYTRKSTDAAQHRWNAEDGRLSTAQQVYGEAQAHQPEHYELRPLKFVIY
jgi:hypothetical protein